MYDIPVLEKSLRLILTALLSSDLKVRELKEVSDLFGKKNELGRAVGRSLAAVIRNLDAELADHDTEEKNQWKYSDKMIFQVTSMIKKSGLSKRDLMSVARNFLPPHAVRPALDKMPISEVVRYVYDNSTDAAFQAFAASLEGKTADKDQYLEGIMSKDTL